MTILTLNREELENKIGKITPEIEEKITMFGTPVEKITDSEVEIEVFPNRPDLLSLQGFTRSFLQYIRKKPIAKFKTNPPEENYKVKVDKSVKQVRPYTVCAIVKNLKLNNEKIKELVEIQEKLHLTIGRKRKKIAIGIYPLEQIKLPIRYTAKKPDQIKFIPLEMNKELTGAQILRQHPKGRDYADLLKDSPVFPIFIDANDEILSMPPIINSEKTGKISTTTSDVFIECSGHNLEYQKKTLNIICTILSDMGGKIYSMNISDEKNFTSPNLEPEELEFTTEDINKTLGLNLSEKEIRKLLEKMGIDTKTNPLTALIPAYRTDILHWIDLTEEVAIAYGYNKFEPKIPEIATIAEEDTKARKKRAIANLLAGLSLLEISSYHLNTKNEVKKMHFDFKEFIELEDSKTEYNCLRIDLLTNTLKTFTENSDSQYPQKIFEIGKVFSKDESQETKIKETEKLSIALADEKANFTDLKQILDYLFKMLDTEYKIEETENSNFIIGRTGKIIVNNQEIGIIGEIAPRCLRNWKVKVPVVALEIDLSFLLD